MSRIIFADEEYYHIYNRGVEKRDIFQDEYDFQRFLESLQEFNTLEPIGSIYEHSFRKDASQLGHLMSKLEEKGLVEIVAYCLNPNHFHLILKQVSEQGVSKFMQRLGNGYTKYFNHKYERSGGLFQGKFKAVHIDSNEYLFHLSVYVNLNYAVHKLGHPMSKSSWEEYVGQENKRGICSKGVILDQFKSTEDYKEYAKVTLKGIQERCYLVDEKF